MCMLRFPAVCIKNIVFVADQLITFRYTARITMYALDHNTGAYITMNITRSSGIAV